MSFMTDIKVMQFGVNNLCGLKGGTITPSLLLVPAAEKKKPLWVFLLELAQRQQRGCSARCCWKHGTHSAQGMCQRRQEEEEAGGMPCLGAALLQHS